MTQMHFGSTTPNINIDTGVRFGIISANNLDPEVVNDIQMSGRDVYYEEAKSELWASVRQVCNEYMRDNDADYVADQAVEHMDFNQDEPIHEFDIECPGYGQVKGVTTWLGGALHVWIFKSPFITKAKLCSPCVPNAGNLDDLDKENGYDCYDTPADWRTYEGR